LPDTEEGSLRNERVPGKIVKASSPSAVPGNEGKVTQDLKRDFAGKPSPSIRKITNTGQ